MHGVAQHTNSAQLKSVSFLLLNLEGEKGGWGVR